MFLSASLVSIVLAVGSAATNASLSWDEHYTYETVLANDASSTRVERVSMEYSTTNETLFMRYRSEHDKGCDEIGIRCGLSGSNVVATKQEYTRSGKRLSDARIWVEGDSVHVEQLLDDNRRKVRSRETGGKPVAADASLMAMFRFFPFDTEQGQDVLIATFTQHFVVMEVRQLGTETITVPAGTFECYKLEGIVDLFVTSIRTVYWLTKAPPHVLVRYEGKRGIFLAPTYVTSLTGMGEPLGTNSAGSATSTHAPSEAHSVNGSSR